MTDVPTNLAAAVDVDDGGGAAPSLATFLLDARERVRRRLLLHDLARAAVWGLAGYGLLVAPKAEARRDQVHLIACR